MSARGVAKAEDVAAVVRVFCACLRFSHLSGAEKIRWNAALAAGRLLDCAAAEATSAHLVAALCEAFSTDAYFKVRAHAGLSLLLLADRPATAVQQPILLASLAFLCAASRQQAALAACSSLDSTHHLVLCFHLALRLLLRVATVALNSTDLASVELIVRAVQTNAVLAENLANCLSYAEEAKVAASVVVKAARCEGGGLARVPHQPMKIAFGERYSLLRGLELGEAAVRGSLEELAAAAAAAAAHLPSELAAGLARLHHLITHTQAVAVVEAGSAGAEGGFRTTYD